MGKKRSKKNSASIGISGSQATLRQESTGKKRSNVNAKSMLKLDHLKNLCLWASGEASIPSLSSLFGHRLAAGTEAFGVAPDSSLFTCQRCESILQPGYSCTVRIEKNRVKLRKNPSNFSQNNVVYSCHFCLHRNLIRGTPLGHTEAINPQKAKPFSKSALSVVPKADDVVPKNDTVIKNPITPFVELGFISLSEEKNEIEAENASRVVPSADLAVPRTPLSKPNSTLLDVKKRKRNKSSLKKSSGSESGSGQIDEKGANTSFKREQKYWTSLKEIVESKENCNDHKLKNLPVPFFL
jgi:hypothetical protein